MNKFVGLERLKKHFEKLEQDRLRLQRLANDAQRLAKQAIFALQRGDTEKSCSLLQESERILLQGKKLIAHESRLESEGAWRPALEEYCEAFMFFGVVQGKTFLPPRKLTDDPGILIGGLSDLIGELVRYGIKAATEHEAKKFKQLFNTAERLTEFLTTLNLTGALRSKGDAARQHLRRLEEIRYDLSLKEKI